MLLYVLCKVENERVWKYLSEDGIASLAIEYMNAVAVFSPPPHRRSSEESQTSLRGNILGKAPMFCCQC